MNVIDALLSSDPVIERLTKKYLLKQNSAYINQGYIKRYLGLYDAVKHQWGNGVYGPKWISTHYTMLELRYMEIDPKNPVYQDALNTLLDHEWNSSTMYNKSFHIDMCIAGMLLSMVCYGKKQDLRVHEIIDYILEREMSDGGWNCSWDRKPTPKISSVHTTLSILEGLRDYDQNGYTYRLNEVRIAMLKGIEVLLSRNLYQIHGKKVPIHDKMTKAFYPPRWKYDILRVLEFLASVSYPDSLEMNDAINLLTSQLKGPFMPKGSQISGLVHFQLEEGRLGMFNTLRALKVLHYYRYPLYEKLIGLEV